MTTSQEYLKFKQQNNKLSQNLKKQKHNFEPTYHQVIKDSIKNDKQSKKYFSKLVKYFDSKKEIICEYCLKPTSHHIVDEEIITKVKGIPIEYKGKRAYCDQCNQNKYVEEIMEYNKKQCYNKIFENTKI